MVSLTDALMDLDEAVAVLEATCLRELGRGPVSGPDLVGVVVVSLGMAQRVLGLAEQIATARGAVR